jgi:hypothetical protein
LIVHAGPECRDDISVIDFGDLVTHPGEMVDVVP